MSRVNKNLAFEFPIDELRKYVRYDAEAGDLVWQEDCEYTSDRINLRRGGEPVGKPQQRGYRTVVITHNKRKFCLMACRMTWAVVHGEWPNGNIFFRDGNKANVSIDNMVHVSPRVNHIVSRLRNDLHRCHEKVYPLENGKWLVRHRYKVKRFKTREDAIQWKKEKINERINELLPF